MATSVGNDPSSCVHETYIPCCVDIVAARCSIYKLVLPSQVRKVRISQISGMMTLKNYYLGKISNLTNIFQMG